MQLTDDEVNRVRQWFDSVQDCSPEYLEPADCELAARLYQRLGTRVPQSLIDATLRAEPAQYRGGSR